MKKFYKLLTILLIVFSINCINICAETSSDMEAGGGINPGGGDYESSDSSYAFDFGNTYPGTFGLKVTVYNKSTGVQIINPIYFLNNEEDVAYLNAGVGQWGRKIYMRSGGYDRLDNKLDDSSNLGQWKQTKSNSFHYLKFNDLFGGSTSESIDKFLLRAFGTYDNLILNLGLSSYKESQLRNFVLVVEPALTFRRKATETFYFGTYWDFYNLKSQGILSGVGSVFADLGNSITIKKGTVNNATTPEIMNFLDNFTNFKKTVSSQDSLGVAILLLKDLTKTKNKQCTTDVMLGSCNSNYIINEPTDEECIVNNISTYKDASVGDCGVIMCSYQISTNLDNFFRTFKPIIKSGRYFPMNSVEIDLKKTCYLISRSDNVGCNNWYTYIKEENAGTLSLELVSKYTLVEDSINSTFETSCSSYSNGKCTKATSTQHIEYVLEPNTNRFISIKDMSATVMGPGDNIIDLGGEHLTTPISLSTGKHNYTIDYSNSILNKLIPRLRKFEGEIDEQKLALEYDYTKPLTIGDLKYSCEYEALNESKCVCEGECCDSNCKVVECSNPDIKPGGFPEIVYRPINLEEAFPGQDGKGRDYGSNWKGEIYDESGNVITKPDGTPYTKEEYYVNYNRGYEDYEVYQGEPLYVIKLDYTSLKKIREYNDLKNHDYNDFELTCTEGEKCISNFLRGRARGFDINLIESGTCKDINSSTFNSCITRD